MSWTIDLNTWTIDQATCTIVPWNLYYCSVDMVNDLIISMLYGCIQGVIECTVLTFMNNILMVLVNLSKRPLPKVGSRPFDPLR